MEEKSGQIYFVVCPTNGFLKIGYTEDWIGKRLGNLQTGSAVPLMLVGVMGGTKDDERFLHDRFKSSRERGEWFRPTPELHAFIIRNVQVEPECLDAEHRTLWNFMTGAAWDDLSGREVARMVALSFEDVKACYQNGEWAAVTDRMKRLADIRCRLLDEGEIPVPEYPLAS